MVNIVLYPTPCRVEGAGDRLPAVLAADGFRRCRFLGSHTLEPVIEPVAALVAMVTAPDNAARIVVYRFAQPNLYRRVNVGTFPIGRFGNHQRYHSASPSALRFP